MSLLLVSATAEARFHLFWKCLRPHESNSNVVYLPEGKSTITVKLFNNLPDDKITCQFVDVDGAIGLEQKLTQECIGVTNLVLPWHVKVKVINESNRNIMYRVLVKD